MSYTVLISSRAARNGLGLPPAGHNDPRVLHSSRRPCLTSSPVFGPRDWEGVFAIKECGGMYCYQSSLSCSVLAGGISRWLKPRTLVRFSLICNNCLKRCEFTGLRSSACSIVVFCYDMAQFGSRLLALHSNLLSGS